LSLTPPLSCKFTTKPQLNIFKYSIILNIIILNYIIFKTSADLYHVPTRRQVSSNKKDDLITCQLYHAWLWHATRNKGIRKVDYTRLKKTVEYINVKIAHRRYLAKFGYFKPSISFSGQHKSHWTQNTCLSVSLSQTHTHFFT